MQSATSDTVVDTAHSLMWRRCAEGMDGDACDQGVAEQYDWAQAFNHVAQLNQLQGFAGYHDWRVPNIRELSTLTELQCVNPAIDLRAFPRSPVEHFWTSSPYHFYTHYSWYVDFTNGAPTYGLRTAAKHLRLVRDIQ